MNRRTVWLATLTAALVMPCARGQAGKALRRVGVLLFGDPAAGTESLQDLIDALQQHGFVSAGTSWSWPAGLPAAPRASPVLRGSSPRSTRR